MVVDRTPAGGLVLLLLLLDSAITAVPSIAPIAELVIVVVVVAVVRCSFSAVCDVGLLLSGTCFEKNTRAVSSPATLILRLHSRRPTAVADIYCIATRLLSEYSLALYCTAPRSHHIRPRFHRTVKSTSLLSGCLTSYQPNMSHAVCP